jgi:hypothetical protein
VRDALEQLGSGLVAHERVAEVTDRPTGTHAVLEVRPLVRGVGWQR